MKKAIAIVLCLMLLAAIPVSVGARSLSTAEQNLFAELNKGVVINGTTYYLPSSVMTQAENYVKSLSTPLTQAQIDQISSKITSAKSAIVSGGVADPTKWSASLKSTVLTNIDEAANVLGLSAVANSANNTITIVDANNNPLVANGAIVKKTGVDATALIIAAVAGVLVLGSCAVVVKKAHLI